MASEPNLDRSQYQSNQVIFSLVVAGLKRIDCLWFICEVVIVSSQVLYQELFLLVDEQAVDTNASICYFRAHLVFFAGSRESAAKKFGIDFNTLLHEH